MVAKCVTCGTLGASYVCGGCSGVHYCSTACQAKSWTAGHQSVCGKEDLSKTKTHAVVHTLEDLDTLFTTNTSSPNLIGAPTFPSGSLAILPEHVRWTILAHLSFSDILRLASVDTATREGILNDPTFMLARYYSAFPLDDPIDPVFMGIKGVRITRMRAVGPTTRDVFDARIVVVKPADDFVAMMHTSGGNPNIRNVIPEDAIGFPKSGTPQAKLAFTVQAAQGWLAGGQDYDGFKIDGLAFGELPAAATAAAADARIVFRAFVSWLLLNLMQTRTIAFLRYQVQDFDNLSPLTTVTPFGGDASPLGERNAIILMTIGHTAQPSEDYSIPLVQPDSTVSKYDAWHGTPPDTVYDIPDQGRVSFGVDRFVGQTTSYITADDNLNNMWEAATGTPPPPLPYSITFGGLELTTDNARAQVHPTLPGGAQAVAYAPPPTPTRPLAVTFSIDIIATDFVPSAPIDAATGLPGQAKTSISTHRASDLIHTINMRASFSTVFTALGLDTLLPKARVKKEDWRAGGYTATHEGIKKHWPLRHRTTVERLDKNSGVFEYVATIQSADFIAASTDGFSIPCSVHLEIIYEVPSAVQISAVPPYWQSVRTKNAAITNLRVNAAILRTAMSFQIINYKAAELLRTSMLRILHKQDRTENLLFGTPSVLTRAPRLIH